MPNKKIIIQKEFPFDSNGNIYKESKDIPDFIKNGFTTKEDFYKAKNFDREWHYMNKSIKENKS